MSQDLGHHHHHHHSVFSFPITGHHQQQQQEEDHIEQHHHIAQQIRRDKLRLQPFQPTPLVDDDDDEDHTPVYEATGMLSEMFNFPSSAAAGATHLLHHHQAEAAAAAAAAAISSDSAMQLFLMNPAAAQTRSALPNNNTSMLLPANPNPNNLLNSSSSLQQGAVFRMGYGADNPPTLHSGPPPPPPTATGYVEGQGLSLSLSSNMLHHLYTNNQFGQPPPPPAEAAATAAYSSPVHVAYGSSLGAVNVLRNSRYLKAARELLEEFCSVVGRSGQFKTTKQLASASAGGGGGGRSNPNYNAAAASSNNNSSSSSTSKDTPPPLLAADRMEHQRRKVKLLAMLDEVEGRYKHYCEEMQMVVNTFELVMGLGAAVAYTALAEKAMSRHFRCLKDAIASQLKHTCDLLGETVISSSTSAAGITKGETPRLKMLDHTLRQQRAAFHQLDHHDAWRPQRGLPDRSVTILRAWLFDHFLHPYPSDADKHLLARQTGLSRNQVSNWFINARVRLWKPMVEEMYQQEAKEDSNNNDDYYNSNNNNNQQQEEDEEEERESSRRNRNPSRKSNSTSPHNAQIPTPDHEKRCHNGSESDPSFVSGNHPPSNSSSEAAVVVVVNHHQQQMSATGFGGSSSSGGVIRFGGPISGDVSLTLGLRHPGNNNYATPPAPPPHNHNHNIITSTTTSFSLTDHFRAS